MYNKSLVPFIAFVLLGTIALSSCGKPDPKDGDTPDPSGNTETESTNTTAESQGTSKQLSASSRIQDLLFTDYEPNDLIQLLKDKLAEFEDTGESLLLADAAYIQSLLGNTQEAIETREDYCDFHPTDDECDPLKLDIDKAKKGVDIDGNPIEAEVTYSIAGTDILSQESGDVEVPQQLVLRVKGSAKGYTEAFQTLTTHQNSSKVWDDTYHMDDWEPVMIKSDKVVTTDADKAVRAQTKNYTFLIPENAFIKPDGSPVEGEIEIHLFDIQYGEDPDNQRIADVLQLDVFSDGFLQGYWMLSFGMPLVKAYQGNTELYIEKQVTGQGKLQGMDRISEITGYEVDMDSIPKDTLFGNEEAIKYDLPGFWNFNRDLGIWTPGEFKLLDNEGTIEFYLK